MKDIWIYSDRRWMVYLLDQLIGNAVKYKKENPKIVFWAEEKEPGQVRFGIQDFGIGIPKEELPYVFQKGYVGKISGKEIIILREWDCILWRK